MNLPIDKFGDEKFGICYKNVPKNSYESHNYNVVQFFFESDVRYQFCYLLMIWGG